MDVASLSTVTDCYVICTAASTRQMAAIQEAVDESLRRNGQHVWHVEGTAALATPSAVGSKKSGRDREALPPGEAPLWLLMDCGDVVIHVFNPPARAFYQLEHLWGDAPRIPLTPSA